MCTTDAVRGGFCTNSQLGKFIFDLPAGKTVNETSFWTARVGFLPTNSSNTSDASGAVASSSGFWDDPNGNPTPPDSEYDSPFRRNRSYSVAKRYTMARQAVDGSMPPDILWYGQPIQYPIRKTGYYCVGMLCCSQLSNASSAERVAIVPVTVLSSKRQSGTDVEYHPSYNGIVLFKNTFNGQLPASDYPKVNVSSVSSKDSRIDINGY